jgi:hypothetical protein
MATLREFFDHEARRSFAELEQQLAAAAGPDLAELYHAIRSLRGAAQMAREDLVHRGAGMFEEAARRLLGGSLPWSPDVAERVRATVDDLHDLARRDEDEMQRAKRLAGLFERWRSVGVAPPAHPASVVADASPGPSTAEAAREFREYVAGEVAAVADTLETGVRQLLADPMDREPLRLILLRQRALLGAARLDEVPIIGEILRAIEDLTRVIAKLNVGTKHEWLDIYRVALEALRASIEPLAAGDDPRETHAVKRLRHLREELLERYGTGEVVSAAHEAGGLVQAQPFADPPQPVAPAVTDETSFVGIAPFTPPPFVGNAPLHAADVDILELSDEVMPSIRRPTTSSITTRHSTTTLPSTTMPCPSTNSSITTPLSITTPYPSTNSSIAVRPRSSARVNCVTPSRLQRIHASPKPRTSCWIWSA